MDVAGYVKSVLLGWERIALPEGYRNVSQILHGVLSSVGQLVHEKFRENIILCVS